MGSDVSSSRTVSVTIASLAACSILLLVMSACSSTPDCAEQVEQNELLKEIALQRGYAAVPVCDYGFLSLEINSPDGDAFSGEREQLLRSGWTVDSVSTIRDRVVEEAENPRFPGILLWMTESESRILFVAEDPRS